MSSLASLFSSLARGEGAKIETCSLCGHEYQLGVTGTVKGCDSCTGTKRALNGFVIDENKTCICLERIGDNGKCPVHGGNRV